MKTAAKALQNDPINIHTMPCARSTNQMDQPRPQTPAKSEKNCGKLQKDQLLQSTAASANEFGSTGKKRTRDQEPSLARNLFKSGSYKRSCQDDNSQQDLHEEESDQATPEPEQKKVHSKINASDVSCIQSQNDAASVTNSIIANDKIYSRTVSAISINQSNLESSNQPPSNI